MFWFKMVLAIAVIVFNTQAIAQETAKTVAKQDSILVDYNIQLDSIFVTPKGLTPPAIQRNRNALTHGNVIQKISVDSDLTTSIPGITANLERDLPGQVTFYSANGFPILTKQSQNHSLIPTMAYAVMNPTVSEPTALRPGPDAVLTLTPTYRNSRNIIIAPLHQRGSFVAGGQKKFSLGVVAEHYSPGLLEEYIDELNIYAETYSGLLSARFKTSRSTVEVTGQHQVSKNEISEMFNVDHYQKNDDMSTLFASANHKWGILRIGAGYGYQKANSNRGVDEDFYPTEDELRRSQDLLSNGFNFSLGLKNTTLKMYYHDVKRSWSDGETTYINNDLKRNWSDGEAEIQNTQVTLTHEQPVTNSIHLILSTRVDYHDDIVEPSMSSQLLITPTRSLFFEINAAYLYDPISSHVMNSGILNTSNFTIAPITTRYASLQTRYSPYGWEFNTSMIVRSVDQHWYSTPSKIEGIVLAASIMRTFNWSDRVLSLNLNTRKRWLDLIVDNQPKTALPGPPTLQAGFRTEFGTNRFGLMIDSQLHINRSQSLTEELVTPLGTLFLVNAGVTTRFGPLNLGLTVGNAFGNIYDNVLFAYQRRLNYNDREIDYVKVPFYPGISVDIDF